MGTQYRSVIFYTTDHQKEAAAQFINDINASSSAGVPIITEIKPLDTFYEAEEYHKNYFARNPGNPYCEIIINPKLEKVQHNFATLLKEKTR